MSDDTTPPQTEGPRTYRAPGRVNLIGEHTDYNGGFVMPAAIDLYTQVTVNNRDDRNLAIRSSAFSNEVEIDLDDPKPARSGDWTDYVRGVAVMLERAGHRLSGANLDIRSTVPIGAGLSSSAALEVSTGFALLESSGIRIDRVELARLCQKAENEFAGMRCGIMDQFVACLGREGHALMLDCRSLEYRLLPLPENVRLVVCNTMVKHDLAASEYNKRRAECEAGVRYFADLRPEVHALRDVTIGDLERRGDGLPEVIYKRCRHVISENARVVEASSALERGDLTAFGKLMAESHSSLRDNYEVSCVELDTMVDLAAQIEGVYGARMTGGGFGGCTVNLVSADCVAAFKKEVAAGYERAIGVTSEIYVCSTADGASEVPYIE
jgi:galactokinase